MAAKTIKTCSFSRLKTFEECPYRAKLAYIDKIEEPERPAPPKGGEHANVRGERVHKAGEDYIHGKVEELSPDLSSFEEEFSTTHSLFEQGKVESENLWTFDYGWQSIAPDDWKNIWLRVIIDIFVHVSKHQALVADIKTGKRYRNEFKHDEQCRLYGVSAFMRYPELQKVTTELWYVDLKPHERMTRTTFSRKQGERFFSNFNKRLVHMTSTTDFPPKPYKTNCMFCPYAPEEYSNKWVNKNGACPYGVA